MITQIYAALLGLILMGLSINVIKKRGQYKTSIGDNDSLPMKLAIRAQGNLAEYAPMFILLLGFSEYSGLPGWAVHFFGCIFLAGRIMHAYSLLKAEKYENHKLTSYPRWRIYGMKFTLSTIGFLAIIVLSQRIWAIYFS